MSASVSPPSKTRRFEFLDGLRGLAALLVAFQHFYTLLEERSTAHFPSFLSLLRDGGQFGVHIFFVLSGFVIAYSIRQDTLSFRFSGLFLLRRSIRLDPPYWATLILLVAFSFVGPFLFQQSADTVPSLSNVWINAFYLPILLESPAILPVAWTLCLEIQFYLTFILVLQLIQFCNQRQGLSPFSYTSPTSLIAWSLLFIPSLLCVTPFSVIPSIPGFFIPVWYSFFMGCLICWTLLKMTAEIYLQLALGALAILGFLFNVHMLETFFIAAVIYGVAKQGTLHTYLKQSIFQYLGKISYSFYLIHWPIGTKVINLIFRVFGTDLGVSTCLGMMILATLVSILAADLFYRLIEEPSLQLSHRIKNWARKEPATSHL